MLFLDPKERCLTEFKTRGFCFLTENIIICLKLLRSPFVIFKCYINPEAFFSDFSETTVRWCKIHEIKHNSHMDATFICRKSRNRSNAVKLKMWGSFLFCSVFNVNTFIFSDMNYFLFKWLSQAFSGLYQHIFGLFSPNLVVNLRFSLSPPSPLSYPSLWVSVYSLSFGYWILVVSVRAEAQYI